MRTGQIERRLRLAAGMLLIAALGLGGCSSSSLTTNLFGPSFNAGANSSAPAAGVANTDAAADLPCPSVSVRTGASTLMIGSKPGDGEPAPLDVRYQGVIVNTARECHVNSGLMTIKVGVEGRVLVGPAGGPGTVEVPLRIAVVREGVNPVTLTTKAAVIPVVISQGAERATFAHIEPELAFPLPQPPSLLDNYVVYVGFDPLAAKPQKKPTHKPQPKRSMPRPG